MADEVDVAVYIALNEEFRYVLATLPEPVAIREDPGVSLTYYFFELAHFFNATTSKILVVSAGAMGPPRAAAITAHVNACFRPKIMIVVGISGSLGTDLLLGDVLIPKIVNNYLSVGAAVPSLDAEKWEISPSNGSYRSDSRLLDRFRHFSSIHPQGWQNWKDSTATRADELLKDQRSSAIAEGLTREEPAVLAEEANLASGELLGKATGFVAWLKKNDRKYFAMDMESSGVME